MNFSKRFCAPIFFSPDGDGGGGGAQTDPAATGQEPAAAATPKVYDEAYVTKLRNEAADHRVKAKEYQDKLKSIEDSQKSELQKERERAEAAEKERDRLKGEQAQAAVASAYRDAATAAGAKNPATVARLLGLETIKGADTGTPDEAAVKAALEALRKSDPDLFKTVGPSGRDASAGSGAGGGKADFNEFIRGKMRR